jgi:hypothetical protein
MRPARRRNSDGVSALFELDAILKLPLWAQVLIAARMARRAVLHLPKEFDRKERQSLLALCDALDEATATGEYWKDRIDPLAARMKALRGGAGGEAVEALYWAWDAAGAAHGAVGFPVDATCIRDVENALAAASRSEGLSPLRVRLFAAADLDQIRFACGEGAVGFYDALGPQVMGRLAPVYPPDEW